MGDGGWGLPVTKPQHVNCYLDSSLTQLSLDRQSWWGYAITPLMYCMYIYQCSIHESSTVFKQELQQCEMMDLTSHKTIRADNILKVDNDGRIGEQMLCVQPALFLLVEFLCKPTILVKLDEPMVQRPWGIKASISNFVGGGIFRLKRAGKQIKVQFEIIRLAILD